MAKISKLGFFKATVDISSFFNLKDGEVRLTFREPSEAEMYEYTLAYKQKDDAKAFIILQRLWADCLEDWTVQKDDVDERIEKAEMVDLIRRSSGASIYLVTEWQKQLPLARASASDSEKSPELTLKAAE